MSYRNYGSYQNDQSRGYHGNGRSYGNQDSTPSGSDYCTPHIRDQMRMCRNYRYNNNFIPIPKNKNKMAEVKQKGTIKDYEKYVSKLIDSLNEKFDGDSYYYKAQ
eukprot:gene4243-7580_t